MEDANEFAASEMAAEEEKGRPHYTRERADDLSSLYMGTTKKGSRELVQVAVRFHHKKIPQGRSDEGPGLYDPGANNSFISERRAKELTLPVENKPSSISNGDGSVQYSPGYVDLEVSLAHGLKFKTRLIVAPLARYDMIIGLDIIERFQISLLFKPMRLTAVTETLSGKKGRMQKVSRRVNIPTCLMAKFDQQGRDISAYACDASQFNHLRKQDKLYGDDDILAVIPGEDDCLCYNLVVKELFELANTTTAEEFRHVANTLLSDLATPKSGTDESEMDMAPSDADTTVPLTSASSETARPPGLCDNDKNKFSAPSAHELSHVEERFRAQISKDFMELCSDSLPTQGPSALLPDGTPYKVKLKLKPNVEPESRRQFRIPEAYREELRRTIDDLVKYKLIEPSISPYSNPVFLVPKPPRPDGSYAGLRFVFDGRSINRAIVFDSHMIPRVEEIIDRIAILKFEAERAGKKHMIISTLDQKTSFWQLALDEDSRPITSFNAAGSSWQWTCLPMGIVTASAHLQRFTEALLKPFSGTKFEYETRGEDGSRVIHTACGTSLGYIDDVCVVSFGTEDLAVQEHEILLRRVLTAMEKQNVRLTPAKCEFFRIRAGFLGHVLSADGISQQDKKLDAIRNWPIPHDLKGMRAFVSLCSYYRKFVANFAAIARPLTDLLKTGAWVYPFTEEVLQAIQKLKTALTTAPVLRYFDVLAKTDLYVDASKYAIGAVLQQTDSEGNSHPIGYYSRRLNPAECNYDTYKKELLGLRDAVLNFRHQLLGIRFSVYTDNSALQWIFKQKEISGQLSRWIAVLSEFMIDNIYHIAGVKNIPADALSRYPMDGGEDQSHLIPDNSNMDVSFSHNLDANNSDDDGNNSDGDHTSDVERITTENQDILTATDPFQPLGIDPKVEKLSKDLNHEDYKYVWSISAPVDVERLKEEYAKCTEFNKIYAELKEHGSSHQYPDYALRAEDDLLFFCDGHRFRLCVPTSCRSDLLSILHDDPLGGHFNSKKMTVVAMTRFYWQGMRTHIQRFCETCDQCQRNKAFTANARGIPKPLPIPARRFDVIALDIVSGFPPDADGNDAAVVFTDRLTKRAWIEACNKGISAYELANMFMRTVFRSQGLPTILLSDRGPQFISDFWTDLFASLKTQVRLTSAYHPASNGGSERLNRTLIEALRAYVNARHDNWSSHLLYFEFTYNNSVNPATGFSPFILQFAQTPRGPIDLINGAIDDDAADFDASDPKVDAATSLSLTILNNVTEARDHLHEAARKFRERHAALCKPHHYKEGEQVLLSSKNIRFRDGCQKLSPSFVGPFKIIKLVGANAVEIKTTGHYRALHAIQNVCYLRPYHQRTTDIGHLPSKDTVLPIMVDADGREWFIVAEVLNHRHKMRPGKDQLCKVRFEGFDSSYDEWLPRKDITVPALLEYEKFLERNARANNFSGPENTAYVSFVGKNQKFSVRRTAARTIAKVASASTSSRDAKNADEDDATKQPPQPGITTRFGRVTGRKTARTDS